MRVESRVDETSHLDLICKLIYLDVTQNSQKITCLLEYDVGIWYIAKQVIMNLKFGSYEDKACTESSLVQKQFKLL